MDDEPLREEEIRQLQDSDKNPMPLEDFAREILKILLDKQLRKFLQKQEKSVQLRIYNALQDLNEIPPIGDILKMQGRRDSYRLRTVTYRVV